MHFKNIKNTIYRNTLDVMASPSAVTTKYGEDARSVNGNILYSLNRSDIIIPLMATIAYSDWVQSVDPTLNSTLEAPLAMIFGIVAAQAVIAISVKKGLQQAGEYLGFASEYYLDRSTPAPMPPPDDVENSLRFKRLIFPPIIAGSALLWVTIATSEDLFSKPLWLSIAFTQLSHNFSAFWCSHRALTGEWAVTTTPPARHIPPPVPPVKPDLS